MGKMIKYSAAAKLEHVWFKHIINNTTNNKLSSDEFKQLIIEYKEWCSSYVDEERWTYTDPTKLVYRKYDCRIFMFLDKEVSALFSLLTSPHNTYRGKVLFENCRVKVYKGDPVN